MEFYKYIAILPALIVLLKPKQKQKKIGNVYDIEDEVTSTTPFFDVYDIKPKTGGRVHGKFNILIRESKNKAGVYVISRKSSRGRSIVYIGHATKNLYKTITRHFHEWTHTSEQVTYDPTKHDYEVKIFYTRPEAAPEIECYFINEFQPVDNTDKCKGWTYERAAEKLSTEPEEEYVPF